MSDQKTSCQTACLPMYDWPEVQPAWNNIWESWTRFFNGKGIAAPAALTRFAPDQFKRSWSEPQLFLTQICALPYVQDHREQLTPFAAFDLDIDGFEGGGWHRAIVLVRQDDERKTVAELKNARWAFNSHCSQTGVNSLRMNVESWPYFTGPQIVTGGHRQSAQAVAESRADFAALDPFSWWLFQRYEPALAAKLRVATKTAVFPSLPLCAPTALPVPPSVQVDGLPEIKLTAISRETYLDAIKC